MNESAKHRRAFEIFYGMGAKRSLPALAKRLNVSHSSAKLWSRTFAWTARIADRDESVADLVEQKSVNREVDRRTQNKQIVQAGIIACARAVADGTMKPTLADLDRMIRLQCFQEGEADSRQEIIERDLRTKTTAELRAMVRSELRALADLTGEEDGDFEVSDGPEPR